MLIKKSFEMSPEMAYLYMITTKSLGPQPRLYGAYMVVFIRIFG